MYTTMIKYFLLAEQECHIENDSVAQLDRALDYESRGRRFESCRGHHFVAYYVLRP